MRQGNVRAMTNFPAKRGGVGHRTRDCRSKVVATGANAQPIMTCYHRGERGTSGVNAQSGTISFDKSFVSTNFSTLININPVKLDTSYEVESADGKIVSTNTILKGCSLNLVNHLFEIDLMPIKLGTFDVIIGIDWLSEYDAVIVWKYIERGCHFYLAQVTEKEPVEKRVEDVPIIRDFPKVFPENLSGIPPPQQVEFQIELVLGVAPVAHAPYHLALSEMKELSDPLQELLEKGFICLISSPWGALVLFVKKKDGSFWMCIDYREINKIRKSMGTFEDYLGATQERAIVSPWKVVIHFGKRGKLNPRYIRQFKILARVGPVAYKLELPKELQGIHHTFHVLNMKKCLSDESLVIPLDEIHLDEKLHSIKESVEIMDREVKQLKQSLIPIVKVR
ncbi:putative reverse transcriptase domain-containing protein [Tanacetum coccineum]